MYKVDNKYQKAKIKNLEQRLNSQKYNIKKKKETNKQQKKEKTKQNKKSNQPTNKQKTTTKKAFTEIIKYVYRNLF